MEAIHAMISDIYEEMADGKAARSGARRAARTSADGRARRLKGCATSYGRRSTTAPRGSGRSLTEALVQAPLPPIDNSSPTLRRYHWQA